MIHPTLISIVLLVVAAIFAVVATTVAWFLGVCPVNVKAVRERATKVPSSILSDVVDFLYRRADRTNNMSLFTRLESQLDTCPATVLRATSLSVYGVAFATLFVKAYLRTLFSFGACIGRQALLTCISTPLNKLSVLFTTPKWVLTMSWTTVRLLIVKEKKQRVLTPAIAHSMPSSLAKANRKIEWAAPVTRI